MANNITLRTLHGLNKSRRIVRSIHLVSDGTEETDLIVYNNSDFIADTAKGKISQVWVMGKFTGAIRLEWDQTTDEPAISVGENSCGHYDFRSFGGIGNPNAAGATGDLLLTTTALANLDEVTLIVEIMQN